MGRGRELPVLREKELVAVGVNIGPLRQITVVVGRAGGGNGTFPPRPRGGGAIAGMRST
ncbi:hypothetical protein [Streptomyces venetus]|uniref:hypothetical protein n=1 Tax=Streptomyces venetus TaxID=1701086 RepID=UPI003C2D0486